jgi:hypothetical protein
MRTLAVIIVATFALLSTGCVEPDGVLLQPPVQGEWSNFHNDKHQVSKEARAEATDNSAADKR